MPENDITAADPWGIPAEPTGDESAPPSIEPAAAESADPDHPAVDEAPAPTESDTSAIIDEPDASGHPIEGLSSAAIDTPEVPDASSQAPDAMPDISPSPATDGSLSAAVAAATSPAETTESEQLEQLIESVEVAELTPSHPPAETEMSFDSLDNTADTSLLDIDTSDTDLTAAAADLMATTGEPAVEPAVDEVSDADSEPAAEATDDDILDVAVQLESGTTDGADTATDAADENGSAPASGGLIAGLSPMLAAARSIFGNDAPATEEPESEDTPETLAAIETPAAGPVSTTTDEAVADGDDVEALTDAITPDDGLADRIDPLGDGLTGNDVTGDAVTGDLTGDGAIEDAAEADVAEALTALTDAPTPTAEVDSTLDQAYRDLMGDADPTPTEIDPPEAASAEVATTIDDLPDELPSWAVLDDEAPSATDLPAASDADGDGELDTIAAQASAALLGGATPEADATESAADAVEEVTAETVVLEMPETPHVDAPSIDMGAPRTDANVATPDLDAPSIEDDGHTAVAETSESVDEPAHGDAPIDSEVTEPADATATPEPVQVAPIEFDTIDAADEADSIGETPADEISELSSPIEIEGVDTPVAEPDADEAVSDADDDDDPWGALAGSEAPTGLDAPLSSHPTPAAYRELENLPPVIPMEGESAEPEGPSEEPQEDQTDAGVPADLPSGSAWATRWAESAQGWVTDTNGATTWRPIVSTLHSVSRWNIDTHLGVVSGDSPLTGHEGLAEARESALEALVQESLTRGAHAVVGVEILVHQIGDNVVLTATGTAVTLSPID